MILFREFVKEAGGTVTNNVAVEMARIAPIEQTKLLSYRGTTYRIPVNTDIDKFICNLGRKRAKSSSMKDTGILPVK